MKRDSVDLLWAKLGVPEPQDAIAKLKTTKRPYKDWIPEDTICLSTWAKETRLSGRPEYRRLKIEATQSVKRLLR